MVRERRDCQNKLKTGVYLQLRCYSQFFDNPSSNHAASQRRDPTPSSGVPVAGLAPQPTAQQTNAQQRPANNFLFPLQATTGSVLFWQAWQWAHSDQLPRTQRDFPGLKQTSFICQFFASLVGFGCN